MELLWILLQVAGSRGNQWNGILMVGIVVLIIYIFIRKSKSRNIESPKYSNNQIKETIIVNQNNMSQEIKCPQCGGNKVERTDGRYKCMYCGTMFQPIVELPEQEQPVQSASTVSQVPATPSSNVNVTVNVPNTAGYGGRKNDNNFSKGAAQGAGVVAGGCLTATAIIWAIPFILFLALLSMCSSSI